MKSLNVLSCLALLLIFHSCQKKEIFQPVDKLTSSFLKDSREYSKSREEKERSYLQKWVDKQRDSLNNIFQPTSSGIWLRFIENKGQPRVVSTNWVEYSAEIKTLSGEVIYTTTEFGKKQGILGKFKDIRGIESALYMMGKGDVSEIVLPSFTAYGLYGDENKIGANVPLLITLTLDNVKTYSNK
jgi:gliding motility-associated peptidyl-prolyl isomerase